MTFNEYMISCLIQVLNKRYENIIQGSSKTKWGYNALIPIHVGKAPITKQERDEFQMHNEHTAAFCSIPNFDNHNDGSKAVKNGLASCKKVLLQKGGAKFIEIF